ncbi:MAG TPA: type II toxin-antitoxin system RelE/ParE family toxin [Candidatus Thermoplasmatota archaeon]|nr:type II toxin-antitoxin system RelE/ParE family toxin [Candidatus Thermoplasmatota archaeon]
MAWALVWSVQALRDLESLDTAVARRVYSKLQTVLADPPRRFERLKGADSWKLRVGDWRVLALQSNDAKTVLVERIGHRSTVYR